MRLCDSINLIKLFIFQSVLRRAAIVDLSNNDLVSLPVCFYYYQFYTFYLLQIIIVFIYNIWIKLFDTI